jgi:hypothetical protein
MSIKGFGYYLISEAAQAALQERAENNNVPVEVLTEVFDRGVLAWDESTNKTPGQYAFNRVDSFLAGGYAAKLDADLLEMDTSTYHSYMRKSKHVVTNTPEDSKVHKKAKAGIERATRLLDKKGVKEDINEVYHIVGKKKDGTPFVSKPHNTRTQADSEHSRLTKGGHIKDSKVVDLKSLDEMLSEEKIRHPEHKKAYVEPIQANGEAAYKASNKHGRVKHFNHHGRESAFKHAGIDPGPKPLKEVSQALAHKIR